MTDGPRYAIYFVPERDSVLYRFGAAILGYDCYVAGDVPYAFDFGLGPTDRTDLVREPQKYGFHATLKAPFSLSPGCSEAQLVSALDDFATRGRIVPAITPVVQLLDGFVAIVPREPVPAVNALAADCVVIFDAFRAPMTAQERARRLASGLTTSEIGNLERWGYPYVLSEFRFHMTLTGRLARDRRDTILAAIRDEFLGWCNERPIPIDRLALLRQDHPSTRFGIVRDVAIGNGSR